MSVAVCFARNPLPLMGVVSAAACFCRLAPARRNEDDGCQLTEAAATMRTFHPFVRTGTPRQHGEVAGGRIFGALSASRA